MWCVLYSVCQAQTGLSEDNVHFPLETRHKYCLFCFLFFFFRALWLVLNCLSCLLPLVNCFVGLCVYNPQYTANILCYSYLNCCFCLWFGEKNTWIFNEYFKLSSYLLMFLSVIHRWIVLNIHLAFLLQSS